AIIQNNAGQIGAEKIAHLLASFDGGHGEGIRRAVRGQQMELIAILRRVHQSRATTILGVDDLDETSQQLSVTGILELWRKKSESSDRVSSDKRWPKDSSN